MALFDDETRSELLEVAVLGGITRELETVEHAAFPLRHLARSEQKTGRRQLDADLRVVQALDATDDNRRLLHAYLDRLQELADEEGFVALAAVREKRFGTRASARVEVPDGVPERILTRDSMLPWRYLERGVAAVKGVGKLVTPVHVGGVATGETGKGPAGC